MSSCHGANSVIREIELCSFSKQERVKRGTAPRDVLVECRRSQAVGRNDVPPVTQIVSILEDIRQRSTEDAPPIAIILCIPIPTTWLSPILGGCSLARAVWAPFHAAIACIHHRLGVAMGTKWTDLGAADPRIECVVSPLDRRVLHGGRSFQPKPSTIAVRALLPVTIAIIPRSRSRTKPSRRAGARS